VTDMKGMFDGATSFNQPLGKWKTNTKEVVSSESVKEESPNTAQENQDTPSKTDKYAIRRRAEHFESGDGGDYLVIAYLLVRLYDFSEEEDDLDSLEGDVEKELFEFVISTDTNTLVQEELELVFYDPYREGNYRFNELEDLFERDVKEYGDNLRTEININNIKDSCLAHIKNQPE